MGDKAMKAKRGKKLALSSETVRRLSQIEMTGIVGGATTLCTNRPAGCQTTTICTESCGPISVCICA